MSARKDLFARAVEADPDRLHFAAHSHHLWPDATFAAQVQAWEDAARLADRKWSRVMGEVYPAAQDAVARELALPSADGVVFAPNTHALLVALVSAFPRRPLRVLATDGEFHSFRRQAARWAEAGEIELTLVPAEAADFAERFAEAARPGRFDLIFASHVFFKTGMVFDEVWRLAELARPEGPWVVVDGYHGFRAVPTDLAALADRVFYLGGGYKYAMAGEGAAFLCAPPGFGPRPVVSGWYAEFAELEDAPGAAGYGRDASRFMGATFDPSGLYRFTAAARMLEENGLTTPAVGAHVLALQDRLVSAADAGEAGRLSEATLLNPPAGRPGARFLAFQHPDAAAWSRALADHNVVVDVRDDVLRIGFAIYHDGQDVERLCEILRQAL